MNKAFDYNGALVSASKPVKQLRTVKKTFLVDSSDRDTTKYFTNGDFVVYLPRVYENVVSIRLMAAEFPPTVPGTSIVSGALTHSFSNGQNIPLVSNFSTGQDQSLTKSTFYFLLDIQGLNKTDECSVGAYKSTFTDSYYAKIPVLESSSGFIEYNDHSGQENIARYTPAIGKLDRLHIRTRLHSQQGNEGFIYWTTNGNYAGNVVGNQKGAEFSLSFEIEYLDNIFDDFSSLETRIGDRSA
jgi:hypothetical protein